jgi:hypothetical protein
MASKNLLQGGICRDGGYDWSIQTVLRIEALSEEEVFLELQGVMEGQDYSWHSINELLQGRLDQGDLEFTRVDGDVLFEWNILCNEKRRWERKGRLSQNCVEFNRDCLINLMILPFQGGLEGKFSKRSCCFNLTSPGLRLVTTNVDKPNLSTMDLWVAHEKWEIESFLDEDSENTDDDDDESLSWVAEDSEDSDNDEDWEERYIEDGYARDDVDEEDGEEDDVDEDVQDDVEEDVEEDFEEYFEEYFEEDFESEED